MFKLIWHCTDLFVFGLFLKTQYELRVLSLLTSSLGWQPNSRGFLQCFSSAQKSSGRWTSPEPTPGTWLVFPETQLVPSVFGYRLYLVFREGMPSNMLSEPDSSCLIHSLSTLPDCGFVPPPGAKPLGHQISPSANFCPYSEVNITGLAVFLFFFLFPWGSSSLCKPCTLMMGKVM